MDAGWLYLRILEYLEQIGIEDGGTRQGIACAADRFYEKENGGAIDALEAGFKYAGIPVPRLRPDFGPQPQQLTIQE